MNYMFSFLTVNYFLECVLVYTPAKSGPLTNTRILGETLIHYRFATDTEPQYSKSSFLDRSQ